jgi:2-hydroxychromene-2-carboxylate isomerase
MPPTIDFYFSIDSRYSYLAATQIPVLEREFGATVNWRPLGLSALLAARGATPFSTGLRVSGQYEHDYRDIDTRRWAEFYGVKITTPDWRQGDWDRINLAAVAAAVEGSCRAFVTALYDAVMVQGAVPKDDAALARIADQAGLDGTRLVAGIDAPATAALHRATIEQARQAGVFGVPSFVTDGEMFWGNDRLILLRHRLSQKPGTR